MPHAAIRPGTVLQGTYEVIRLVGAGGMGEVYEVRHRRLSGRYAVKFLIEASTADPEVLARFRREAAITSRLRHPNIVQVVDFDQTREGVPYLVMEYLDGSPLDARIPPGARLPISQTVWLTNQVASALAAAHSQEIVHRDLKPQNIFLVKMAGQPKEMVKVLDFGISKMRSSSASLTRTSAVLGTPRYMAPEQTSAPAEVDGRADQFSLAAIAYELFTGAPAFAGETVAEILHSVLHTEPPPLAAHGVQAPAQLEEVMRIALSKQPEARFADILEFSRALEAEARIDDGDSFARSEASRIGRLPAGRPGGTATLFYGGPPARSAAPAPRPAERPSRAPERPAFIPEPIDPTAGFTLDGIDEIPQATSSRKRAAALAAVALLGAIGLVRVFRSPSHPSPPPQVAVAPTPAPALPQRIERSADRVQIDVLGAPAGVQVFVDGVVEDLPVQLDRGEAVHVIRLEAPGYEPREWKVSARKSRALTVHLSHRKGAALAASTTSGDSSARWNDPFTEGAYAGHQPAPLDRIVALDKSAIAAFRAHDQERAKAQLMEAVVLGKEKGLGMQPALARAYLHLGVVYVDGFKDPVKAQRYFTMAQRVQPGIELDPELVSPAVRSAMAASAGRTNPY